MPPVPLTPEQIKTLSQAEVMALQPFIDCVSKSIWDKENKRWQVQLHYRLVAGGPYLDSTVTLPGQV